MRDMIINAVKSKMIGKMNSHIANIEVMLTNPAISGNNNNIIYGIEKEISALQELHGKINILTKYFERTNENAIEEQKAKSKSK
ncbi:MAG: hypothetical protein CM15mV78_540 [uncultured marine virus]|nr:MAG: hypothetical protein CM15mV78_540 [uncultured marine virus]